MADDAESCKMYWELVKHTEQQVEHYNGLYEAFCELSNQVLSARDPMRRSHK